MRIRWQSFIDPQQHAHYFALLEEQLARSAPVGTTFEVVGMQPPDEELHRLTEARCANRAIANAILAERDGYDAFLIGHFQDSGLHEARSAVGIPVLGLGETAMLHACTLGQCIGLVTIHPLFIPWHREQIARYGLGERVIGVTAMGALSVTDYVAACAEEEAFARVVREFERASAPLTADGAEVLIPAGGLPALVLSRRPGLEIRGAAILNAVPVLARHGAAAVELARQGLPVASRRGAFALPSVRALQQFLESLASPPAG